MWIWKRGWVTHTSRAFWGHNNSPQASRGEPSPQCPPRRELHMATSTVRAKDSGCAEKTIHTFISSLFCSAVGAGKELGSEIKLLDQFR